MSNNVDFKKVIAKARLYPDMETWKAADPDSYATAEHYNVLGRPEISRHMQTEILDRITLEDVKNDMRFQKTYRSWKQKAPVTFWAAYRRGWLNEPEIFQRFGKRPQSWDIVTIARVSERYRTRQDWARGHPASWSAARKQNLVDHPSIVGHMERDNDPGELLALINAGRTVFGPEDIARAIDPVVMKEQLEERARRTRRGRLEDIGHGYYMVPNLKKVPPEDMRDALLQAFRKEMGWSIRRSPAYHAWRLELPCKSEWVGWEQAYEREGPQLIFDLARLHGKARSPIRDLRFHLSDPYSAELPDDDLGDRLRALLVVKPAFREMAVERVLAPLSGTEMMSVYELLRILPAKVAQVLRGALP